MSDYYVNASEAIRMVRAWDKTEGERSTYTAEDVVYLLEHLTPVRANEIRSHGRWIKNEPIEYYHGEKVAAIRYNYECSECGRVEPRMYRYCPECGARMDEEVDE